MYKRNDNEFGCYYFHRTQLGRRGKIYDYQKSKEFCENIDGKLPIIKSKEEDTKMLSLLQGYVSIVKHVPIISC